MVDQKQVFGLHAVTAALKGLSGEATLFVQEGVGQRVTQLAQQARGLGTQVQFVDRRTLDTMCGGNHQGVLLQILSAKVAYHEDDLESLLEHCPAAPLVLALDCVQDPHNLGACIRSALAMGAVCVLVPKDGACSLNATVRKVACGAAEQIPFIQVANLARTLGKLKQLGLWVVGTAEHADSELREVDLTQPLVLVVGSEGSGLRRLTQKCCDHVVRIATSDQLNSLNVSVACGISLYEVNRQRCVF